MDDPLATYLHDHLAGAKYAIDLAQAMRDHYRGTSIGEFANALLREIVQDRDTLRDVADIVGGSSSGMRDAAAWLSEKVSRFKLDHSDHSGLGTFETLEFLQIGIHGKLALWKVMAELAPNDPRLAHIDFNKLALRAQKQEAAVDERRLQAARQAFLQRSVSIKN